MLNAKDALSDAEVVHEFLLRTLNTLAMLFLSRVSFISHPPPLSLADSLYGIFSSAGSLFNILASILRITLFVCSASDSVKIYHAPH